MIPAYNFRLGQNIEQGLVAVCKFDGKTPSLACGTTGGKIILHSPHDHNTQIAQGQHPAVRYLNLNRKLTAIAAGSLTDDPKAPEILFVGSPTSFLAYDVERNADVFYKEVQDGVNAIKIGRPVSSRSKQLIFVGGNCSIVGFDKTGTEAFWTVTGDNVSSMEMVDIDGDGIEELLVGSDDFEVRAFKDEDITAEITETDKITFLTRTNGSKFAYALANGTVGCHDGVKSRLWRAKTKHEVTALAAYDMDGDGVKEIIVGWSNGSFQVRRENNGDILFKDSLPPGQQDSVAAIVCADYRLTGREELIVCMQSGEVRGFIPSDVDLSAALERTSIQSRTAVNSKNVADQEALAELQSKKLELMKELKRLEKAFKSSKAGTDGVPGSLPPNTMLAYTLEPLVASRCVQLSIEATTDVLLTNVVVVDTDGGVLQGHDVLAISPFPARRAASIALRPAKDMACNLRVQTHVAVRGYATHLHVFEQSVPVPKFSRFVPIAEPKGQSKPKGKVSFLINESVTRLFNWMKSVFIIPERGSPGIQMTSTNDKIKANFLSVSQLKVDVSSSSAAESEAENQILYIYAGPEKNTEEDSSPERGPGKLKVEVYTQNMDLAGDIVQDMCKFFGIEELESSASFPKDMEKFEIVLGHVADLNADRLKLTANMAEDSQRVKALIVRAEDSRLMEDMDTMRRAYTDLNSLNNQLVANYNIRAKSHEDLLSSLKEVNQMIQRAANLRAGSAKTRVISECRAAVKSNNFPALNKIICQGYEHAKGKNVAGR